MNYTIYNTTTGQIERVVDCPPEMVSLQFDPVTHAALEGSFDDSSYYVEAGVPVAMPPKPTPHHVFDYTTKQWIDPRTPETEGARVRAERDRRLQETDWTQLPDVPLATKEAWAAYRQALRDITEQPGFPFDVVWPEPPA